jgi:hypothetical protein
MAIPTKTLPPATWSSDENITTRPAKPISRPARDRLDSRSPNANHEINATQRGGLLASTAASPAPARATPSTEPNEKKLTISRPLPAIASAYRRGGSVSLPSFSRRSSVASGSAVRKALKTTGDAWRAPIAVTWNTAPHAKSVVQKSSDLFSAKRWESEAVDEGRTSLVGAGKGRNDEGGPAAGSPPSISTEPPPHRGPEGDAVVTRASPTLGG